MQKVCTNCGNQFEVTEEQLNFLEKVSPVFKGKKYLIPPPAFCPACRQLRKLAFRNERNYHKRTCSKTGRSIIAEYPPETPFPVYCETAYWNDNWDALEYGTNVDFNRPFFVQFKELQDRVPRLYFSSTDSENSEYCNHTAYMKNCYLVVACTNSEDCYYCHRAFHCKDCHDCHYLRSCELCYECTECENCYDLCFADHCQNIKNSRWLKHCRSSSDLLFCINIKHGQYQILNKQFKKEDFKSIKDQILNSPDLQRKYLQKFNDLVCSSPFRASISEKSENIKGNYIRESHNCDNVFDVYKLENVNFAYDAGDMCDSQDIYSFYGPGELCYECYSGCFSMHRCLFIRDCWPGEELIYCDHCHGCSHCFGCIGLQKKKYCILNRQYAKEQYEELIPQIIEQMKKNNEWGEYFPISISPYPRNDSAAQEISPLTKKEAENKGLWWYEKNEPQNYDRIIQAEKLPSDIKTVPDDVCNWAIKCLKSNRLYRIIKQELQFYRRFNLPLPKLHPDERHKARKKLKNPWRIWQRQCQKCGRKVDTGFAPGRPEIIYCEECYRRM